MSASEDMNKGMDALMLLAIGAGAYLIYKFFQAFNPNNPNTPVGAATNAVSSGIADLYDTLTFGAPVNATGTLASQSGQVLGPISSFPATTEGGVTYLQVNGAPYQLGPRNASGNFTAIPVGNPAGGTTPAGGTSPAGGTPYATGTTGVTYTPGVTGGT